MLYNKSYVTICKGCLYLFWRAIVFMYTLFLGYRMLCFRLLQLQVGEYLSYENDGAFNIIFILAFFTVNSA